MSESEGPPWPPKYSRKYLSMHLNKLRELFWQAAKRDGIEDYSIDSLKRLDAAIQEHIGQAFAEAGCPDPDLATLWFAHAMLGSYFGDVLTNNLGGSWRFPNRLVTILGLLFGRPDWIYRHWFVVIGRRKIPVFVIAMRRDTLGKEKASLVKAYEEIAEAVGGK